MTLVAGNRALLWPLNFTVSVSQVSPSMFLSRFVSSLLEEPEVVVNGAGQGPAGSIIRRLFVNAQKVRNLTLLLPLTLFTGVGYFIMWLRWLVCLSMWKNRFCNLLFLKMGRFNFNIGNETNTSVTNGVAPTYQLSTCIINLSATQLDDLVSCRQVEVQISFLYTWGWYIWSILWCCYAKVSAPVLDGMYSMCF